MRRPPSRATNRGISSQKLLRKSTVSIMVVIVMACGGCQTSPMRDSKVVLKSDPLVWPNIRVVTPADAGFEAELKTLFGDKVQVIKQLEPYILIVSNESRRKIVAYSAVWTITRRSDQGRTEFFKLLTFPNTVAGGSSKNEFPRDGEIYPGEARIAGASISGDKNLVREAELWRCEPHGEAYFAQMAQSQSQHKEYTDASEIKMGLDAVIFDDGELVGPDRGHLAQHFSAYVNAEQSIYRKIVEEVNSGSTIDDVFAQLKTVVAANDPQIGTPGWEFHIYDVLAATDAISWRSAHGDSQLVEHFKRSLRETPFAVWQKS
jgi:hypothetical protein